MPVLFYLDPQFDEDPRCASVNTITLSYTFFRVDGAEENRREAQQALQAAAAGGAQAAHATA
jgi:cytochrome c oxidase assembly protein Cox11